jgi:hypothetical protein
MYLEHREFYANLLAEAQEHLAETEVNWPETLWVIPWELVEARKLVAKAQEEFDENEESIAWEEEQKAAQCCRYDYCDCDEEDY